MMEGTLFSMSSSDSDSSTTTPQPRALPRRGTRGQRVTDVHKEGDDEFWSQDFFAELSEGDDSYESETEEEDVVDSDFDDTEEEEDEEEVKVAPERRRKTAGQYVDPVKKVGASSSSSSSAAAAAPPQRRSRQTQGQQIAVIKMMGRRKSTRGATQKKAQQLEEREAEAEARPKPKRRKTEPHRVYTQEERLKRAEQVEVENRASLEALLRVEEERKRVRVRKEAPKGARVRWRSKDGRQYVAFSEGVPAWLCPPKI